MNKKVGVIMWVILIATIFAFSLWLPRKQKRPETTGSSPTTQENVLPNQKRMEEIIAETKRNISTAETNNQKIAEEQKAAQLRVVQLRQTVTCAGKKSWEKENCENMLTRLAEHNDISMNLSELAQRSVKIEIHDFAFYPDINEPGTRWHEPRIFISSDGKLIFEPSTSIATIQKFLGLPVAIEKTESSGNNWGFIYVYE